MLVESLFKGFMILGSEWVLWLLIGLSMLSTAVVIAKWRILSKVDSVGQKFWIAKIDPWIQGAALPDSEKENEVLEVEFPCLESKIVKSLYIAKVKNFADREKLVEGIIGKEKLVLEKQLSILGTLGSNAPFIGLFGTVLGIIKAFAELGATQAEGAGMGSVTGGLAEALVATAVGLLVAIPSVIFYNLFQKKVKSIVSRTQSVSSFILGRG